MSTHADLEVQHATYATFMAMVAGELFLVPDPNLFYPRSGRALLGFYLLRCSLGLSKLEAWRAHIVRTPAAVLTSAVARLPLLFE
jgi:hypothetical protein